MISSKTHKECAAPDCVVVFKLFKTTDKFCSWDCKRKNSKPSPQKKIYKIPKRTKKQAKALASYFKVRADFMNALPTQICPVFPNKLVTDVHHKKGKEGYADKWAIENNIPLLIDVRFFLAVSRPGHTKIELNPIWAKENNFSVNRLDNPDK